MGYNFHKKGSEPFYIRLSDASAVRAAAGTAGLAHLMPETEASGGTISVLHHGTLASVFREQSKLLTELADYFDNAAELRWGH